MVWTCSQGRPQTYPYLRLGKFRTIYNQYFFLPKAPSSILKTLPNMPRFLSLPLAENRNYLFLKFFPIDSTYHEKQGVLRSKKPFMKCDYVGPGHAREFF